MNKCYITSITITTTVLKIMLHSHRPRSKGSQIRETFVRKNIIWVRFCNWLAYLVSVNKSCFLKNQLFIQGVEESLK